MEPEFNCSLSMGNSGAGNNNQGINNANCAVEDITRRLDQINVDMIDVEIHHDEGRSMAQHLEQQTNQSQFNPDTNLDSFVETSQPLSAHQGYQSHRMFNRDNYGETIDFRQRQQQQSDETILMQHDEDNNNDDLNQHHEQAQSDYNSSNILIVTNVDSSVFNDKLVQSNFEALFLAHDSAVTFRYLKSFRRVRIDFTDVHGAEMARSNLSHHKLGNTEFRCYSAQIIRPNNNNTSQMDTNSRHLNIPKLTKQFLISPPASPPVGWEPVTENSPCIDVQLISAIANLVPGKVHEIHPGNESQPGIYVEVCEDVRYETPQMKRIPRTMSPGCCQ